MKKIHSMKVFILTVIAKMLSMAVGLFFLCSLAFAEEQIVDINISNTDKLRATTYIYGGLRLFYAHWNPEAIIHFEKRYKAFLSDVAPITDRRNFSLKCVEFMAQFHNSATAYIDDWLFEYARYPTGFKLIYQDDQWIVSESLFSELLIGSVVTAINTQNVKNYFDDKTRFVSASSEREALIRVFDYPYLFEQTLTLSLNDGNDIVLNREHLPTLAEGTENDTQSKQIKWRKVNNHTAYLHIPSFAEPEYEKQAIEKLKENKTKLKTLILDLRDNEGGEYGDTLLPFLIRKTVIGPTISTSYLAGWMLLDPQYTRYNRGGVPFPGSLTLSPVLYKPKKNSLLNSHMFVLLDHTCQDECEYIAKVLKGQPRITLLGSPTIGRLTETTPLHVNKTIRIDIGDTRVSFADNTLAEGKGVRPDIIVRTTANDLRHGRDPLMEKAMALIPPAKR